MDVVIVSDTCWSSQANKTSSLASAKLSHELSSPRLRTVVVARITTGTVFVVLTLLAVEAVSLLVGVFLPERGAQGYVLRPGEGAH